MNEIEKVKSEYNEAVNNFKNAFEDLEKQRVFLQNIPINITCNNEMGKKIYAFKQ